MAFTVNDLQDLLRLLREHPEWRAEVRREVLGDELLTLPDLVRQNSEAIEGLTEAMRASRKDLQALAAAAGTLVDWSRRTERRVADMREELLGLWYLRHSGVLARLHRLRRFRVPELAELELLEEAVDAGTVSMDELGEVYLLDCIIVGREVTGREARDALLAVEVSSKIDMYDVRRAEERAAILRKAGYAAYPVVAGHEVDEVTERYIRERGIQYHLRPDESIAAAS